VTTHPRPWNDDAFTGDDLVAVTATAIRRLQSSISHPAAAAGELVRSANGGAMLFPLATLKADVAKRVSLWDRELVTSTEAKIRHGDRWGRCRQPVRACKRAVGE